MIYVSIEAIKSEGRGAAKGSGWHDTDESLYAIRDEWERFHRMWDSLGHGGAVTYRIEVATEASPRRTKTANRWPLPVAEES